MADNNRNWSGSRSSNRDWDDNDRYGNDDDRGSFRGRYEGGQGNDWGRSGQDYGQGSYRESRYDRDNDYTRSSNYGSSNYGGYGGGQSDYGRDYSSYGSDRNRGERDRGDRIGGGFGFGESGGFRSRYDRERQSYSPGGYQNYGGGSGYGSNQWTGGYGGSSYGRNMGNTYGSSYGSSDYSSGGYGGGLGESFGRSFGESGRGYGDRSYDRNYGDRNYGSGYGSSWDSGRRDYDRNRGRGDERGWWDRTTDEISSWFGDEEAERRRRMDRQHKGRGPKNYQRSDERIKEDVNDRLSDDWFVDASEIDVSVQSGEVTLSGTVDERTSKRRAEDIAESVSGVKHVENRLRVTSNQNMYSGSDTGRTSAGTTSTVGASTGTTGMGASTSASTSRSRQSVSENK